jgi:hypothetical protein
MDNAFNFAPRPSPVTREDLAVATTQKDTPTFEEGFQAAVEYDGTIPALINRYHGSQFQPDPGYAPSDEEWTKLTEGIPAEDHYKFVKATSPAHAEFVREHLLQEQNLAGITAETPWASVAASLTDPGMLALGAAAAPFALSTKASVLARAVRSGAASGVTNIGMEATLKTIQEREYDYRDAASDFFIGFALGAPLGALASPAEQAMVQAAAAHAGRKLVQEDAQALGLTLPEGPDLGSMGAMATDMRQVVQPINPDYSTSFDAENTPKSALTHLKIKTPFIGEIKIPLRFDMRARLGSSDNPVARYMGSLLAGESVGLEGKAVVRESAAEWAMFHQMEMGTKIGRSWNESYTEWVRANKFPHTEAITGDRATKFDIEIGRALRGETDVSPQAAKVAQSIAAQQTRLMQLAKKHGVEGFENVAENPYYAMRMFNHKRIEDLNEQYGTGNLEQLLSNSLRKVRPDWDFEKVAKVARGYLRAVRVVGRDKQLPKAGAYAQKDRDYLLEKLKDNGFDTETADDILDLLSKDKPEGGPARSKARLPLDETHKEPLKNNLTGEYDDVSVSDLFEQNGSVLFNTYLRQMSGQIALAQVGIKSEAQFKKLMTDMLNDGRGDTEAYARYSQALYDHVVGRPIFTDDFGKLTDAARIISGLNYTRMANQFGFAQIAEMGQFMSPTYIRAFMNGIPAFKDLRAMALGGKVTSKMAKDIEEAIGYGGEFHLHRPTPRSEEDMADGLKQSKVVHQLDRMNRVTSTISGLRSVNNMERGVTANVVIQRLSDWAIKGKLSQKDIDELSWLGLDDKATEAVFGDMKKYLEYSQSELVEGARVKGINYDKWQAEAPDTYDKFRFTVYRETNRIILDPDIGKTPYILHHPLIKPLFQFRRFMLVAYSSHLLKGMHNMNLDTAAAFAGSMFLGGIAYMMQTGVNYANDPEALEKHLAPEEIAKAAFNRAGFSSILPMVTDSALGMLGYDPQFAYTRNSTLPSGALIGNPSVDFANKLWNTAGTATGVLAGNRDATQQDIKSAYSLLPFNNAVGIRNLGQMLSKQFPKHDPNETYEPQQ